MRVMRTQVTVDLVCLCLVIYKQYKFASHGSGGWKSKIKALVGLVF